MHSFLYFGFIVLFIATVLLEIDHQLPESLKFLHGHTYQAYSVGADVAGVVFLVGIGVGDRAPLRAAPYRIRIKTKPEDAVILGTFLRASASPASSPKALRIALGGRPDVREVVVRRLPALGPHRRLVGSARCSDAHRWLWAAHVVAFLGFLAILPTTKLRHMFTSPMNMYLKDRDRPKGAMKPMPNLMETELETFGAVEDRGLHLEAAVRHRRVHGLRPLHVGVPGARDRQAARPREIVLKVGEVMAATGSPRCRRRSASTPTSRSAPTACSSASRPRRSGRARAARRATRSAR